MKKTIVLCADDFGQAEVISEGIANLIRLDRISATSCLVNMPDWTDHARALMPFRGKVDIGLHFNLTLGRPLSNVFREHYGPVFPPLSWWIWRSFRRKLNVQVIAAEFRAQLESFMGQFDMPTHIDGHQHVHQFRMVQDVILSEYKVRFTKDFPYIRSSLSKKNTKGALNKLKDIIISKSGGTAFQKNLLALKVPHNPDFSGIYSFKTNNYRHLFKVFLAGVENKGLIMCHPALAISKDDPIAQARIQEYRYFMSEDFLADCDEQGVVMSRFFET